MPETNGKTEPKKSHEDLRKAIEALPKGFKEQTAWQQLGLDADGKEKLSRSKFRDLWLEIRVPAKKKPEAKGNEKNGKVTK